MFDVFIDTVQGYKKQFVSTFVTEKSTRDALTKWLDAETDFAKQSFKTAEVLSKETYGQFSKMGFKVN